MFPITAAECGPSLQLSIRLDPEKSSHSQNWNFISNHQNRVNNPTLFQRKLIRIEKNEQITKKKFYNLNKEITQKVSTGLNIYISILQKNQTW